MGWLRSGSIQELVGLDITYNLAEDVGVGGAGQAGPGAADDAEEAQYMNAFAQYRQQMRATRERERKASSDADIDSDGF